MAMRADGMSSVPKKAAGASGAIGAVPGMGGIGAIAGAAQKAQAKAKGAAAGKRAAGSLSGGGGGGGQRQTGGTSYSGGNLQPTSNGVMMEQAPPPPQNPSLEDWRAGDSVYNSSVGSIDNDLSGLLAQLAEQNRQYNQDQDLGLRNMGWDNAAGGGQGAWNPDDLLGAYGQTRNNLFNDFSGRGMMDSSFFGDAQTQMTDNFNRQRMDMNEARTGTNNEYAASQGRAQQDANLARQQALADAAARYSAQFGA